MGNFIQNAASDRMYRGSFTGNLCSTGSFHYL